MKKISIFMMIGLAASVISCSLHGQEADLSEKIDSLSYTLGVGQTQGLKEYLFLQLKMDSACMGDFIKGLKAGTKRTSPKDVAYITGMSIGNQFRNQIISSMSQQIFPDSTYELNKEKFLAGFLDGVIEREGTMTWEQAQAYSNATINAFKQEALEKKYADYRAENEKFLADNKEKEGVITTESGLQYKIITEGKGAIPADSCRVKVHYTGRLIDGSEFDSSYKKKDSNKKKEENPEPASLYIRNLIKGWQEALTMMPVGSKWELYIPAELGYGSRESGKIKPFSTLIFEMELVEIEPPRKVTPRNK